MTKKNKRKLVYLYKKFYFKITPQALQLTISQDLIEDIIQDAFLFLYSELEANPDLCFILDNEVSFEYSLSKLTMLASKKYANSKEICVGEIVVFLESLDLFIENDIAIQEESDLINLLSEKYYNVLYLKYVQNLPDETIIKIMKLRNKVQYKNLLRNAMAKIHRLRDRLLTLTIPFLSAGYIYILSLFNE